MTPNEEWSHLAGQLLRRLLPDREHGCLCNDCLREELSRLTYAVPPGSPSPPPQECPAESRQAHSAARAGRGQAWEEETDQEMRDRLLGLD